MQNGVRQSITISSPPICNNGIYDAIAMILLLTKHNTALSDRRRLFSLSEIFLLYYTVLDKSFNEISYLTMALMLNYVTLDAHYFPLLSSMLNT